MEFRSFAPDLEVRSTSKRLLCGIVVPYGVDQRIDDTLTERFEAGAFAHQFRAAHRVRLLNLHSVEPGHMQLGHAIELRDDRAGLYGEFRVVDSPMGDHYLALAREGSLREWSIGFRPDTSRRDGRTLVYTRATVFETALVPEGAYGELAAVGAVRSALPVLTRDMLWARLPKPRFPA
jgi:HK97 family phage prohead protease